jgi:hypothetical protein
LDADRLGCGVMPPGAASDGWWRRPRSLLGGGNDEHHGSDSLGVAERSSWSGSSSGPGTAPIADAAVPHDWHTANDVPFGNEARTAALLWQARQVPAVPTNTPLDTGSESCQGDRRFVVTSRPWSRLVSRPRAEGSPLRTKGP